MRRLLPYLRTLNILFVSLHIAAFVVPWVVLFSWWFVLLAIGLMYIRMFGISAGFHRYFAHRSYRTSRPFQFLIAALGCSALQKGPLWWAANHRLHHKHSDQEDDPHSPVRHGLWWSHIGWVLSPDASNPEAIKDFEQYWELRLLERFNWVPGILLALGCYLAGCIIAANGSGIGVWNGEFLLSVDCHAVGLAMFTWGFMVSTVFLYHCTFLVNSVCHLLGPRRFQTTDESRNNWWVALLTLGEGWHNNHHYYMSSASQGLLWWEIDVSFRILKLLNFCRIVWGVRTYPAEAYQVQTA